jgi:glycosyltransferase involved in cell wall biosynthesis
VTKVYFILDVRYPTEKAYGVTTGFSTRAVEDLDGYSAEIITPILGRTVKAAQVSVREVPMPFGSLSYKTMMGNSRLGRVIFRLSKVFYALKVSRLIGKKETLLWTRDLIMAFTLNLLGYQTIFEVHRRVHVLLLPMLKTMTLRRSCTIVFINSYLQKRTCVKEEDSMVAGMAVNLVDLLSLPKDKVDNPFVVGYLGSIQSSGIRLSLNRVFDTARKFEENHLQVVFRFVGISLDDLSLEEKMSLPTNVQFIGRVRREKVMEEIDKFNVGLVFYPDTKYFQDSFPIKIVEYAARRVPIIASNTFAHRTLLGNDKALYFSLDSNNSLYECLNELIEDSEKAQAMTQAAFNWVQNLTYENRVKAVLDFHNKRNVS